MELLFQSRHECGYIAILIFLMILSKAILHDVCLISAHRYPLFGSFE